MTALNIVKIDFKPNAWRNPLYPVLASELALIYSKVFYVVSRRDSKLLTASSFNAIWWRQKARLNLRPVHFHGL